MRHFAVAFAVLVIGTLASTQAAVYIGGGCYDCNPPGGQAPGVYTANGRGGGGYYNAGGGGGGGGGGATYYNPGGAGRPVYSGNFGPNGYNGGGAARYGGGRGGGGGQGYDDGYGGGVTQYIGA
ncbi:glycine-rich RNA-binding protein 1 [Scaptodrosophila lebanonensis]|uniref:Glycine-rich RNA-binding protein 1 n=1 Tax=Drosophila lebanonensis TaxID=7225 RepID=A0A6J2T427_DROLE|nr:glycine-rich RNA-binding protein 1 [Scaptodrosophila lebanonensis]